MDSSSFAYLFNLKMFLLVATRFLPNMENIACIQLDHLGSLMAFEPASCIASIYPLTNWLSRDNIMLIKQGGSLIKGIYQGVMLLSKEVSYILRLRNALKKQFRNMPLFQNGSALIVLNENDEILLQERTDRCQWCLPGGLQELGETFEDVAVRELYEETGLVVKKENLFLIGVVSGESRKNSYSNGDIVYNNTVLFLVREYTGCITTDHAELVDNGSAFVETKESNQIEFFKLNQLPENLMDVDLIRHYLVYSKAH